MSQPDRIPAADLPPGAVRRAGTWAVGNRDEKYFAVSRRCRHQLGDLSGGRIDADGWTLRSDDGSRGAHAEHTIAVTDGPARILTTLAGA